jgi:hypothetical protein
MKSSRESSVDIDGRLGNLYKVSDCGYNPTVELEDRWRWAARAGYDRGSAVILQVSGSVQTSGATSSSDIKACVAAVSFESGTTN